MGGYLLRRLALILPTLLGILLINFAIVQAAPGGPVDQAIARLQGVDGGGPLGRAAGRGCAWRGSGSQGRFTIGSCAAAECGPLAGTARHFGQAGGLADRIGARCAAPLWPRVTGVESSPTALAARRAEWERRRCYPG